MKRSNRRHAFTLVELLVVIALVGALSALLIGGLRTNQAAALHSAQATLVNTLTAARVRAAASGCRVRVLIHASAENADRFRRTLAVQQEASYGSGEWLAPVRVLTLPPGIVVLPYRDRVPSGFFAQPEQWTKTGGDGSGSSPLHSSGLFAAPVTASVESEGAELWDAVQFTPQGTMSSGVGDIVLAAGRVRAPGTYRAGESPVIAEAPQNVRGVSISTYGVAMLIDERDEF